MYKTQNNIVLNHLNLTWELYLSLVKRVIPTEARTRFYPQCVYEDLLLRFYLGIKSCKLHLTHFEEELRFPIAIQLRSLVLDSMISIYLSELTNDEKKFNEAIHRLNHSSAKVLNEGIEELFQSEEIDKEGGKVLFKKAKNIFPEHFIDNGRISFNEHYNNTHLSASKIKREYCKSKSNAEQDWMKKCYEQYNILSFYEHYNITFSRFLYNDISYHLNKFSYASKFITDASIVAMKIIGVENLIVNKIELLNKQIVNIGTEEFNIIE